MDQEYMDEMLEPTVIIDQGTFNIKAGRAYQSVTTEPSVICPTVVGKCRTDIAKPIWLEQDVYVGRQAEQRRGILQLSWPIQRGIVQSMEDMESVWQYIFYNKLRVLPSQQAVLLTEKASNPKQNRIKMAEIMFENFDVPALYLETSAFLSLYHSERTTTGIVVDCGYQSVECVPVYQGHTLRDCVSTLNIGGQHITEALRGGVSSHGYEGHYVNKYRDLARYIKEAKGYVAMQYKQELLKNICDEFYDESYVGRAIPLQHEIFECYEMLFNPQMSGLKTTGLKGIHDLIHDTITKCGVEKWELCQNIVLSGGCSMARGMQQRLNKELAMLFPLKDHLLIGGYIRQIGRLLLAGQDIEYLICQYLTPLTGCNILAPSDRIRSAWIGGAMLSMTDSFASMCISKDEYQESGYRIVNRKCF